MIQIGFKPEDVEVLKHGRYYHEHPRVRIKMTALWLKSREKTHQEICEITGISKATLVVYLKQYQAEGLTGLQEIRFRQPQSEMETYAAVIKKHFEQHPPASLKEAAYEIEKLTGLKRSTVQVSSFLRKLGFKARRITSIPAKLDPIAQEDFVKKS